MILSRVQLITDIAVQLIEYMCTNVTTVRVKSFAVERCQKKKKSLPNRAQQILRHLKVYTQQFVKVHFLQMQWVYL